MPIKSAVFALVITAAVIAVPLWLKSRNGDGNAAPAAPGAIADGAATPEPCCAGGEGSHEGGSAAGAATEANAFGPALAAGGTAVSPAPAVAPGGPVVALAPPAAAPRAVPRFVDLGTTSCAPCKVMLGVMKELEAQYASALLIEFVNVHDQPAAMDTYGINVIPTQIFFAPDGKELFRHVGVMRAEAVVSKWSELGYPLVADGAR
jgi:thioredoxin 1